MRLSLLQLFRVPVMVMLVFLCGCVTGERQSVEFGIQPGQKGFVPARIAVLSCTSWPNGAVFDALPLSSLTPKEAQDFCTHFDDFILAGFQNQPFMKGSTPKAIAKLLEQAGKNDWLSYLPKLWGHEPTDCQSCANAPSFYVNSIMPRPQWRQWLNELSLSTRNSDAVLVPFLLYGHEMRLNDRGLRVAKRTAAVVMLLIDTNNGQLIWAGGRDTLIVNEKLESASTPEALPYLPWPDFYPRMYINAMWKDFPGRQEYE